MRLDLRWRDFLAAYWYAMVPARFEDELRLTGQAWGNPDHCMPAFSVRSAFDLALRALQLPEGSEVLLSAWTVPDMVRIVKAHGLIPVPVDTDAGQNLCLESLKAAITPRSKLLVVAHLFGNRMPLDDVAKLTREHDILLVEDCAQCFSKVGQIGHSASDFVMHSFGPIKTATAMGGAMIWIKSVSLHARMREISALDPIQSRFRYCLRLSRFAALKLLSGKRAAAIFLLVIQWFGGDADSLLVSLGRGFGGRPGILRFRHRPCSALLRMMRRRWQTYDFGRIGRRQELGVMLWDQLGSPANRENLFWVCPVFVADPDLICQQLRAAGFDATNQSRMAIVQPVDECRIAVAAQQSSEHVLFLPWYPELTEDAVCKMAATIRQSTQLLAASD